jgi:hypothetical protein
MDLKTLTDRRLLAAGGTVGELASASKRLRQRRGLEHLLHQDLHGRDEAPGQLLRVGGFVRHIMALEAKSRSSAVFTASAMRAAPLLAT